MYNSVDNRRHIVTAWSHMNISLWVITIFQTTWALLH